MPFVQTSWEYDFFSYFYLLSIVVTIDDAKDKNLSYVTADRG